MPDGIPAWSKTYKARYNYSCAHCGGVITKGTIYHREVMREGPKMIGALSSRRTHLDCENPWWQPDDSNLCLGLSQLPGRVPSIEEEPEQRGQISIVIPGNTSADGQMMVLLPNNFGRRILHANKQDVREAALANISMAYALLGKALEAAAGHRHRSVLLSNLLHEMQHVVEPGPLTPKKKRCK